MFKIAGTEVTHLTHDSRTVKEGSCFFALKDNTYVRQAIAKGAVVIVTEQQADEKVPVLVVPNVRQFMALASKRFNKNIVDKMTIIGVTGTNGKTTCAHMLKHILGKGTEIIGTLGPGKLTTPDPIELHEIFAEMYKRGTRTVVMEVSAHAIHYHKVAGINFRAAIFTNLTQDHLDFFDSMQHYARTKINFFNPDVKTAIVNIDDEYGRKITHEKIIPYSIDDIYDLKLMPTRSTFMLDRHKVSLNIAGRFNIYNALACIKVATELGQKIPRIVKALNTLPPVAGRFNVVKVNLATKSDISVIIDYAHTPDGLEKILTSVQEFKKPASKLITVFGCGGNRDKSKRELMGQISAQHSDICIITSDNPRDESPRAIMLQIEAGVKAEKKSEGHWTLIEDRHQAINHALDIAKSGDIIVIAGKGAERTQEIAGKFLPFNDEEIVKQYITNCETTQHKE